MKMLVASTCLDFVTAVSSTLDQLGIQQEVCTRSSMAIDRIRHSKLEGLIVDTTDSQFADLIKSARSESSNRTAPIVALVAHGRVGQAFRDGATFALEQPSTPNVIHRTLSVCHSLMVRERRRYFRCPAAIPICVKGSHLPEIHTMTANLSEGGLSFCSPVPADFHACDLQFRLPGLPILFNIRAEIRWSGETRTGVRFAHVPYEQKLALREWLDQMLNQVGDAAKSHQPSAQPGLYSNADYSAVAEVIPFSYAVGHAWGNVYS